MSDLGEILGSILSGISHARRIADEESAMLAEYYRQHPLLANMAVPRLRIPEVVLDLPILIEKLDPGVPEEAAPPAVILDRVRDALKVEAAAQKLAIPPELDTALASELKLSLLRQAPFSLKRPLGMMRTGARESAITATDSAIETLAKRKEFAEFFAADKSGALRDSLRKAAGEAAIKDPGKTSRIEMSVDTESIKARGGAGNVVRIQLVLKEEGLEWSQSKSEDGTLRRRLIPE